MHILIVTCRIRNMEKSVKTLQLMGVSSAVRAPQAADSALSHGLSSLTTSEVADLLGTTTAQVPQRLASAIRRGEWVTPSRGLWVPVPPEYRTWGGPPAIEFIDAMMNHMNVHYYIGWLSAAAIQGAAHHAPQVTQVAVSRMIRARSVGRANLEFFIRSSINSLPIVERTVRSGQARVSSAELTALDLCADIALGGGINNVATVLVDLVDASDFSLDRVLAIAGFFNPAVVRRLGWLLDNYTELTQFDSLRYYAYSLVETPSLLNPLEQAGGRLDDRWNIRVNSIVEPDE